MNHKSSPTIFSAFSSKSSSTKSLSIIEFICFLYKKIITKNTPAQINNNGPKTTATIEKETSISPKLKNKNIALITIKNNAGKS